MSGEDVQAVASIDRAAIEVIRQTPGVLRGLLAGLPHDLLEAPNADGWSLREIGAHLHDVEGVAFVERIGRMLHEDRPPIASIDPPSRLIAGGYVDRPLQALLDELQSQRIEHAAWLTALSPSDLLRAGEHDTVGEICVLGVAQQWAAHDMAHLRQIALMVQQHFASMMGATRGFYDV